MGISFASITLDNPKQADLSSIKTCAVVIGNEVLLGAVPMEDMGLVAAGVVK